MKELLLYARLDVGNQDIASSDISQWLLALAGGLVSDEVPAAQRLFYAPSAGSTEIWLKDTALIQTENIIRYSRLSFRLLSSQTAAAACPHSSAAAACPEQTAAAAADCPQPSAVSACPHSSAAAACPLQTAAAACPLQTTAAAADCPQPSAVSACPHSSAAAACPLQTAAADCPLQTAAAAADCPQPSAVSACPHSSAVSACPHPSASSACPSQPAAPSFPLLLSLAVLPPAELYIGHPLSEMGLVGFPPRLVAVGGQVLLREALSRKQMRQLGSTYAVLTPALAARLNLPPASATRPAAPYQHLLDETRRLLSLAFPHGGDLPQCPLHLDLQPADVPACRLLQVPDEHRLLRFGDGNTAHSSRTGFDDYGPCLPAPQRTLSIVMLYPQGHLDDARRLFGLLSPLASLIALQPVGDVDEWLPYQPGPQAPGQLMQGIIDFSVRRAYARASESASEAASSSAFSSDSSSAAASGFSSDSSSDSSSAAASGFSSDTSSASSSASSSGFSSDSSSVSSSASSSGFSSASSSASSSGFSSSPSRSARLYCLLTPSGAEASLISGLDLTTRFGRLLRKLGDHLLGPVPLHSITAETFGRRLPALACRLLVQLGGVPWMPRHFPSQHTDLIAGFCLSRPRQSFDHLCAFTFYDASSHLCRHSTCAITTDFALQFSGAFAKVYSDFCLAHSLQKPRRLVVYCHHDLPIALLAEFAAWKSRYSDAAMPVVLVGVRRTTADELRHYAPSSAGCMPPAGTCVRCTHDRFLLFCRDVVPVTATRPPRYPLPLEVTLKRLAPDGRLLPPLPEEVDGLLEQACQLVWSNTEAPEGSPLPLVLSHADCLMRRHCRELLMNMSSEVGRKADTGKVAF